MWYCGTMFYSVLFVQCPPDVLRASSFYPCGYYATVERFVSAIEMDYYSFAFHGTSNWPVVPDARF